MPGERFFDTNVLVYAFAAVDPRGIRAESLLAERGVVGVQVLNEFANVARRKLAWDWKQVEAALRVIEDLVGPARPLTSAIHAQAVVLARDHTLAFYDSLIVAAAIDSKCRILFTDDMQHGRKYGGVTVQNPFR